MKDEMKKDDLEFDELIKALEKLADLHEEVQVRKLQHEIKEFEANEK